MKTYLTRWKTSDGTHSAMLNAYGIRRLMRGKILQVCVYELADSVDIPPIPVRAFYDWKFDKLSLFRMNGDFVEKAENGKLPFAKMGEVA